MIFQNSHVFGRQIQSILVALSDQFRPCGGWHGFSDWVNNFVQNVAASHDGLKNKIPVQRVQYRVGRGELCQLENISSLTTLEFEYK